MIEQRPTDTSPCCQSTHDGRHSCCQSIPALARRQAILACTFAVFFLLPIPNTTYAQTQTKTTPNHPRVIWLQQPAHQATIVWTTKERGTDHRVYFDTESHDGDTDAYDHQLEASRTVAEEKDRAFFHHAVLQDLHPSTTYYFTVESDGQTTTERHFQTAPADDRPFKLLYGGDSRSNPENRRKVNRRIRKLFADNPTMIAMVHGGDYVELAAIWDQLDQWLDDWQLTTADDGEVVPIIPARGNHEFSANQLTDEVDNYNAFFGMPGGPDNDYWTTRIGRDVAIVTLDTNATLGGKQRKWLDEQLATLTDKRQWIIPSYHRPAYPAVKSAGAARQHWVPLFEKYNVDLVLESDGHVLKRTVPIRNGEQADDGIVYVGEGGLGVKQRTPKDRWYLESPGMATSTHHVQVLSFSQQELTYRAVTIDGTTVDQKTFQTRRPDDPMPIELDAADAPSKTHIEVDFNKGLASESIQTNDFSLTPTVDIQKAHRHRAYDDHVVLETASLDPGTDYALQATDLTDLLGETLDEPRTASVTFEKNEPAEGDAGRRQQTDKSDGGEVADPSSKPQTGSGNCSASGGRPLSLPLVALVLVGLAGKRRSRFSPPT